MGSTQTVNAAPGQLPRNSSAPLAWGAPNAIALIPWTTHKPMRMDVEIQGLQTLGNYTPPAIAVVEHYDPLKRAIVRDFINIGGGFGPTPISIVSGAPPDSGGQLSTGEVKIAVYNIGGTSIRAGVPKGFGALSKVGGLVGNIFSAINGVAESPSFAITHMRSADIDPDAQAYIAKFGRFGSRTLLPDSVGIPNPDQPPADASKRQMPYLSGRIASAFDTGAPAVPQAAMSGLPFPGYPASLDRFGSLGSVPPSDASFPSDRPTPASNPDSDAGVDPKKTRVLGTRLVMPDGTIVDPGKASGPGTVEPPAQSDWPPATRPVPEYPVPPMVYGLTDPSAGSADNMDDRFDRWFMPLIR